MTADWDDFNAILKPAIDAHLVARGGFTINKALMTIGGSEEELSAPLAAGASIADVIPLHLRVPDGVPYLTVAVPLPTA